MTTKNYNPWERLYLHYKDPNANPLPSMIPSKMIREMTYEVATRQNSFLDRAELISKNTILNQEINRATDPHERAVAYSESEHRFVINDVELSINPQNINVQMETYTVKSHALRSAGLSKIPAAKGVFYLRFTVFFVGLSDINSKLRRIIAQGRTNPIFYIDNEFVRQHLFPDEPNRNMAFVLNDLNLTTHPDSPEILIAKFSMEYFNYLPLSDNFYYLNQSIPKKDPTKTNPISKQGSPNAATLSTAKEVSQQADVQVVKTPKESNLYRSYFDAILGEDFSLVKELESLKDKFDAGYADKKRAKEIEAKLKREYAKIEKDIEAAIPQMKAALHQHPASREYKKIPGYDIGRSFKIHYWKYIFFPKEILNKLAQVNSASEKKRKEIFGENLADGATKEKTILTSPISINGGPNSGVTNYKIVEMAKTISQNAIYKGNLSNIKDRKEGINKSPKEFDCTSFVYHTVLASTGLDLGTSRLTIEPNLRAIEKIILAGGAESKKYAAKIKIGNKIYDIPQLHLFPSLGKYTNQNTVFSMASMAISGLILFDFKQTLKNGLQFQHAGISAGTISIYQDLSLDAFDDNDLSADSNNWTDFPYRARTYEAINKKMGVGQRSFSIKIKNYRLQSHARKNVYDQSWLIPGVIYDIYENRSVWISFAKYFNWIEILNAFKNEGLGLERDSKEELTKQQIVATKEPKKKKEVEESKEGSEIKARDIALDVLEKASSIWEKVGKALFEEGASRAYSILWINPSSVSDENINLWTKEYIEKRKEISLEDLSFLGLYLKKRSENSIFDEVKIKEPIEKKKLKEENVSILHSTGLRFEIIKSLRSNLITKGEEAGKRLKQINKDANDQREIERKEKENLSKIKSLDKIQGDLIEKSKSSQDEKIQIKNKIYAAAQEAYKILVRQVEEWRKEAANKAWELIWTTDGNFLFRKKATLDLSGGQGRLFFPPKETGHELTSYCTIDLTYLSFNISNIFARLPLIGHSLVSHQYLGSNDLNAIIQMTSTGNGFIGQLNYIHKYNQTITKLFRRIPNVGVIEVENELLNMAGSKHFLIDSISSDTVPQSPHLYTTNIQLTEWNIKQRQKEEVVQEKVTNINTKNEVLLKLLKNVSFAEQNGNHFVMVRGRDVIEARGVNKERKSGLSSGSSAISIYPKYKNEIKEGQFSREEEISYILGVIIYYYLGTLCGYSIGEGWFTRGRIGNLANDTKFHSYMIMNIGGIPELNTLELLRFFVEPDRNERTKKIMSPFERGDDALRAEWTRVIEDFRNAFFSKSKEKQNIENQITTNIDIESRQLVDATGEVYTTQVSEIKRSADKFVQTWGVPKVPRLTWAKDVIGRNSWVQTWEWLKNNFQYYTALGSFAPNTLAEMIGVDRRVLQVEFPQSSKRIIANSVEKYKSNAEIYNQKAEQFFKIQYDLVFSYASLINLLRDDLYSIINIAMPALRNSDGYFEIMNQSVENVTELKGLPAYQDIPLPYIYTDKQSGNLQKQGSKAPVSKNREIYYANPGFFWQNLSDQFDLQKFISISASALKEGFSPTLSLVQDFGVLPSKDKYSLNEKRVGVPGALAIIGDVGAIGSKIQGALDPKKKFQEYGTKLPDSILLADTPYLANSSFAKGKFPSINSKSNMNIGVTPGTSRAIAFNASDIKNKADLPLYKDKHPYSLENVSFGMSGLSESRIPVTMSRNPETQLEVFQRAFSSFEEKTLTMNRAFPAFKLYFIEDDTSGKFSQDPKSYIRSYDDFFSFNAIKEIKHYSSRKLPSAILIIRLSNLFGNLDNLEFSNSIWDKSSLAQATNNQSAFERIDAASLDTVGENPFKRLILKDGMRVQFKGGYENNPEDLTVVFNGQIVEVNQVQADEMVIVCQDFGTQLVAEMKGANPGDIKSDWNDTFELLSWAATQPEMLHFGKWQLNVSKSIGESRSTGGWEKVFDMYADTRDDNLFCPRRHEMIALQSDTYGGLFSLTKWFGRRLSQALAGNTETKVEGFGVIKTEYVQSIGDYDVYVTTLPAKLYQTIEAISLNENLGRNANPKDLKGKGSDTTSPILVQRGRGGKIEGPLKYVTVSEGRGDSGLLDYVVHRTKIWNIFKEMELRHPGWIGHPVPYGDRMTMFFGLPTQLYWWRPLTKQEEIESQGIIKQFNNKLLENDQIRSHLEKATASSTGWNSWWNSLGVVKFYKKHWVAIELGLVVATLGAFALKRIALSVAARLPGAIATAATFIGNQLNLVRKVAVAGAVIVAGESAISGYNGRFSMGDIGIANALNNRLYERLIKKQMESRLLPFRKYHLITSDNHIVANNMKTTLNGIYNAVTLEYDPSDSGGASSTKDLETLTYKATYDILDKDIRMGFFRYPQCRTRYMANRYAQGLLIRYMKDMYRGDLVIWGDWKIKPYDVINLSDSYSNMTGRFEVEEVVNVLSPEIGHLTTITPDFCIYGNNMMDLVFDDYEAWFGMYSQMSNQVAIRNLFEYDNQDTVSKIGQLQKIQQNRWLNQGLATGIVPPSSLNSPVGEPQAARNKAHLVDGLTYAGGAAYGLGTLGQLSTTGAFGRSVSNLAKAGGGIAVGAGLLIRSLQVPRNIRKSLSTKLYNWTTERQPMVFQPMLLNGRPMMSGIPIERIGIVQRFKEAFIPYVANLTKGFDILEAIDKNIYMESFAQNLAQNLRQ